MEEDEMANSGATNSEREREQTLFEALPDYYAREGETPIGYKMAEGEKRGDVREKAVIKRMGKGAAQSEKHRARSYDCQTHRRPISKIFPVLQGKRSKEENQKKESFPNGEGSEGGDKQENRFFVLHSCCVPVRGARRSTVCDLQRGEHVLIPNKLHEILTEHSGKILSEIKDAYDERHAGRIEEYLAFLVEHDLGFWSRVPQERFPRLDLSYERPGLIDDAIIDDLVTGTGEDSGHDYRDLIEQLSDMGCETLQVRFFAGATQAGKAHLEKARMIAGEVQGSALRAVEVIAQAGAVRENWKQLCCQHARISKLMLYGAEKERTQEVKGSGGVVLVEHPERVDSHTHCGKVHPARFVTETSTFAESAEGNTCLNRKVSVGENGQIRNCPSLGRSFGDAKEIPLQSVVIRQSFRELWEINKDQIAVCSDCEFRRICTDCRAFIEEEEDCYSKPSKCSYDPYTATWQD